jgi:hypothetical protein
MIDGVSRVTFRVSASGSDVSIARRESVSIHVRHVEFHPYKRSDV